MVTLLGVVLKTLKKLINFKNLSSVPLHLPVSLQLLPSVAPLCVQNNRILTIFSSSTDHNAPMRSELEHVERTAESMTSSLCKAERPCWLKEQSLELNWARWRLKRGAKVSQSCAKRVLTSSCVTFLRRGFFSREGLKTSRKSGKGGGQKKRSREDCRAIGSSTPKNSSESKVLLTYKEGLLESLERCWLVL